MRADQIFQNPFSLQTIYIKTQKTQKSHSVLLFLAKKCTGHYNIKQCQLLVKVLNCGKGRGVTLKGRITRTLFFTFLRVYFFWLIKVILELCWRCVGIIFGPERLTFMYIFNSKGYKLNPKIYILANNFSLKPVCFWQFCELTKLFSGLSQSFLGAVSEAFSYY